MINLPKRTDKSVLHIIDFKWCMTLHLSKSENKAEMLLKTWFSFNGGSKDTIYCSATSLGSRLQENFICFIFSRCSATPKTDPYLPCIRRGCHQQKQVMHNRSLRRKLKTTQNIILLSLIQQVNQPFSTQNKEKRRKGVSLSKTSQMVYH